MSGTQWVKRQLAVIFAVARVTFFEIVRDKVLYNSILGGLFLLSVGWLASRLSFVRPDRIVTNFGLSTLNISCALLALLLGAGLLPREFERRTAHVALSKPISRIQFIVGKITGLWWVLASNWLIFATFFYIILIQSDGEASGALLWGLALTLVEAFLLGTIALFFTTFSTTSLSVVMGIGIYLSGHNVSQLLLLGSRLESALARNLLTTFARALPNLEHFVLGKYATYGIEVGWKYPLGALVYGMGWIAVLLAASAFLIRKREI